MIRERSSRGPNPGSNIDLTSFLQTRIEKNKFRDEIERIRIYLSLKI